MEQRCRDCNHWSWARQLCWKDVELGVDDEVARRKDGSDYCTDYDESPHAKICNPSRLKAN